ncbi:putative SP-containing membrane protein [Vairimorpha necatrix]|uniref:SP-containing membrane protein n=1 Tax=Vairimorpha necatrix TaxID=6039 RepID=A0AAX4J7M1_9MICR
MILLLLNYIYCTEEQVSTSSSYLYSVLIFLDLIFLLFVAHSKNKTLKKHTSFILMSHGTVLALKEIFGLGLYLFVAVALFIAIIYYNISSNNVLLRLIYLVNSGLLTGVIFYNISDSRSVSPTFSLQIILILCGFYLLFAVIRVNILVKIHTVVVGYLLCCYFLYGMFNISLLNELKENNVHTGRVSKTFFNLFIILTLSYIEFAF